jgi:hypothetical protein
MMFSISGVMFLFGLTWLFAILLFTVIELQSISQLLFTIFNSLQGFFIFVFILNTEAVGLWKKLLGCGSKSNLSPRSRSTVSTQRTRVPRLSTSQSGSSYVQYYTRHTSDTQLIEKSGTERKISTIKVEETIIESQMEEVQIKEDLSFLPQQ